MHLVRSFFFAFVLLLSAAHARQLLLMSIAKAAMKDVQPANQKMAVTVARWGEGFGFGEGQESGGSTGDDDWGFGGDGEEGEGDGGFPDGQTSGGNGGFPSGTNGIGGLAVGLFDAIVGAIRNILMGVFGLINQIINGGAGGAMMGGYFNMLIAPAQAGTRQSLHQFHQMAQPQKKAIGGLVMRTVGLFDSSLQKQLSKFNGHETAIRSELQYVKRVLEQPHPSGNHLVQKLHAAAPKLSGTIAASYKRAVGAFRQQFARLDRPTKTGIHKLTNNLKQAQLKMSSVLNKANAQHKKALGPAYNVMKNVHTMSHALL